MSDVVCELRKLDDADVVFPANGYIRETTYKGFDTIPMQFQETYTDPWCELGARIFMRKPEEGETWAGLFDKFGIKIKEGLDEETVCRAITAQMGTFGCSHEHKIASLGYMFWSWFDKVEATNAA